MCASRPRGVSGFSMVWESVRPVAKSEIGFFNRCFPERASSHPWFMSFLFAVGAEHAFFLLHTVVQVVMSSTPVAIWFVLACFGCMAELEAAKALRHSA